MPAIVTRFEDLPGELLRVLAELTWPAMCGVNKASQLEWDAIKAEKEAEVNAMRAAIDEELEIRRREFDAQDSPDTQDAPSTRRLDELPEYYLDRIRRFVSIPRFREAEGLLYSRRDIREAELKEAFGMLEAMLEENDDVVADDRVISARDKYFESLPELDRDLNLEQRVSHFFEAMSAAAPSSSPASCATRTSLRTRRGTAAFPRPSAASCAACARTESLPSSWPGPRFTSDGDPSHE
eukprot:jgi/Mesvir1/14591/Mv26246-RA.1